jgi:hypothetical protein
MDKERILNYTYIKIMIDFIDGSFNVLNFHILDWTFHSKPSSLFLTDLIAEKNG